MKGKVKSDAPNKYGYDQIVYLLQGGGALGAYQAGICAKLEQIGFGPNWVIGTSIGAIHSAIIAGNAPQDRAPAIKYFWQQVTIPFSSLPAWLDNFNMHRYYNFLSAQWAVFFGVPNFFTPRILNPWFASALPLENVSFYDPENLRKILKQLVDFDRINTKKVRLSLAAIQLNTGNLIHFDNTREKISLDHIMASAALPPAFPPVKINGKFYWDGGISANTPLSILLEEKSYPKLLCFMMNLFSPSDLYPTGTLDDAMRIQKDIVYSSHYHEIVHNYAIVQHLRHAISELGKKIPKDNLDRQTESLISLGEPRLLKLFRFHYTGNPMDLSSKDYNFSETSIKEHMNAGYFDAEKAFIDTSWISPKKNEVGIILHEFKGELK